MPHNNAMQPTANQLASHRELVRSGVVCAAADGGRWVSSFRVKGLRIYG